MCARVHACYITASSNTKFEIQLKILHFLNKSKKMLSIQEPHSHPPSVFANKGLGRGIVDFAVAVLLSSFGHRYPHSAEAVVSLLGYCILAVPSFPSSAFPSGHCQYKYSVSPGLTAPLLSHTAEALAFPGALGGESTLHLWLSSMKGWGIYTYPHGVIRAAQAVSQWNDPPPAPLVGNFEVLSSLLHKGSWQGGVSASCPQ